MSHRVVPCTVEILRELDANFSMSNAWLDESVYPLLAKPGFSYALIRDERVIGAAGIALLWPGCGEAWCAVTEEARLDMPFSMHKYVKRYMEKIIHDHGLHRIQCIVLIGYDQGRKWVERMGFEWEGTLREYDQNKQTFHRYARLV